MTLFLLLCTVLLCSWANAITSPWRPILPIHTNTKILHHESTALGSAPMQSLYELEAHPHLVLQQERDTCSLYKVSMDQQLYFEYVHYKMDLPDLKEFTLCAWTKFHNHSNDHPLFSYAVGEQPRGILSWVANTPRSSYYMLNVDGHTLYRLNYPLRLNKWYHSCQSWNGNTGEWQIWVNDERVGRGFNNRLVGHVIKGGGIAISGQEQRQLGGGFLEGEDAPPGSGGYLGELTMLQLYGSALTVGKAHKDHKHHHAHHYEHDTGNNIPRSTTRPQVTGPPLPQSPFLTGGQINSQVKINPGATLQIVKNGVTLRHPALPMSQNPPPQPFPPVNPESLAPIYPTLSSQLFGNSVRRPPSAGGLALSLDGRYHNLFKREKDSSNMESEEEEDATSMQAEADSEKLVVKRDAKELQVTKVSFVPRKKSSEKKLEKRDSEKKKRGLVDYTDGLMVDGGYTMPQGLDEDYFTGLASFSPDLSKNEDVENEREPAELEVKLVMEMCNGCAPEPFEKALIMDWRSVPKKLYSGALYLPAAQTCKGF
ncbi:hypothetical protein KM043_012978 [Ampulex compressa]|nr:hypothetical protein KM043_012978 [Ampulex compressa]